MSNGRINKKIPSDILTRVFCVWIFMIPKNQLLFIHFWCSISLNPTPENSIRWFVVECKRTKLEKLYRNKSFECCCLPFTLPVIIYYYWGEKSYHIFHPRCAKVMFCRIFHVSVPLIEIYDILTRSIYFYYILWWWYIFYYIHSDIIFHFLLC